MRGYRGIPKWNLYLFRRVKTSIMKILAISGSLRNNSSNTALVRAIIKLAPPGMEFRMYEGLGTLPHFIQGMDGMNSPDTVREFRSLVEHADGVMICTPEYAFGVPGVLKNALDWLVGS